MSNRSNDQVIVRLQRYLKEKAWLEKATKKNPFFAHEIESLTADQISFGYQPTFVRGYITGNSTGSGESTYGDTKTKRTTSIEFNTGEKLFIADNNKALTETCRAAASYVMDGFSPSDVISKRDARSVAEKYGKERCREALSDLNFPMSEYRLNRYAVHTTSDAFRVPIWPIYASIQTVKGDKKDIFIGYYYTSQNDKYIHLDIDVPLTGAQKWIIFGAIAGAVTVAITLISMLA